MGATWTVRPLTTDPAIHTYFDVVPESPDGGHVTWFAFDGKPLTHGRVVVANRDGSDPVNVTHCRGNAHCGAHQGWLDSDHIFFAADGQVQVAHRSGRVVQRYDGAVDTIHQASRRALVHSNGIRKAEGTPPKEQACYRIDLTDGTMVDLLDRATAFSLIADHVDLTGVDEESMNFQHTKWSPDGTQWFVVFANEIWRRTHPGVPRVKVILAAAGDGSDLRFVDSFGHHPNWLPDGSGIYAFADGGKKTVVRWGDRGGEPAVLARFPAEGHPCVSPDSRWITSDTHHWPSPGRGAVLLHDLQSGETQTMHETDCPTVPWQTDHPPAMVCHPHPVWSADGQRVYFNAVLNEMPQLCVANLETSD